MRRQTEPLVGFRVDDSWMRITDTVNADLHRVKVANAFITLAFTSHDLTKPGDWNFVFGEANASTGTGVFSFARYREGASSETHMLRRCCMVLAHEVGHLLGLSHCVWSSCLMNGSNHLDEGESRAFALCPADLRKLADTLQRSLGSFDPVARERALVRFFAGAGMEADRASAQGRLEALCLGEALDREPA
jgi:archaemetzincin